MKTVNALQIRNHLGQVLQELEETKEPVLVSKGRKDPRGAHHTRGFPEALRRPAGGRGEAEVAEDPPRAAGAAARRAVEPGDLRELRGYPQ